MQIFMRENTKWRDQFIICRGGATRGWGWAAARSEPFLKKKLYFFYQPHQILHFSIRSTSLVESLPHPRTNRSSSGPDHLVKFFSFSSPRIDQQSYNSKISSRHLKCYLYSSPKINSDKTRFLLQVENIKGTGGICLSNVD